MCGIGGIIQFDDQSPDRAALEAMRRVLSCRGPDGYGIEIDRHCGLVHTRLAVIDPAGGHQPMKSKASMVVFNGEIYNHRKLRGELQSHGHAFTTDHSDTEVLLHGYRQWAEDLVLHLDGMYAFAIWDGTELYLARDRVGKKPLYYWKDDTRFIFASTAAAVVAGIGAQPAVETRCLPEYLTFGYTAQASLFRDVMELPRQTWLLISPTRQPSPPPPRGIHAPPATPEYVEVLLRNAVERRLESDVPLGCFLSGGIDSSLVAALAQQQLALQGGRLKTFSMAMPDARYDESPWARRVAEHLGTEHHELTCEPDIERDLLALIGTMGEPTADSSILPTYWLSRAARRHVTVALSGDGGDELFGGYERYAAVRMLRRHALWLRRIPAGLLGGEQKSRSARLRRMVEAAQFRKLEDQYLSIVRIFSEQQIRDLGVSPSRWPAIELVRKHADPAERVRFWDWENYLPLDLLRKVDRASMAVGLEVRCPMLDSELAETALFTPMSELMPGTRTKPLLRKLALKYIPAEVVERKKMGFAVPIGHGFRRELRPMLHKWLLDSPALPGLGLHRPAVEKLVAEHESEKLDHTHRLFALLTLAMWHRTFMGGVTPR